MSTPQILVLGAGKSATSLIEYLQKKAVENNWYIVLADGDKNVAENKWNNAENGHAIGFNIEDGVLRNEYIKEATVVVSMLPAYLHFLVAKDCLQLFKPLFTASYVDEQMQSLAAEAAEKKVLFLCEMGLDPGIDHMSAMELIHRIQNIGGKITSFKSHCGGLIAPESDNNPWHYKISWNPRNIILAGKAGALFLEENNEKQLAYEQLFHQAPKIQVPTIGALSYYPNRNSLSYIGTYSLNGVENFMRTTLRHPDFCKGWDAIIQLGLTSETPIILNENETVKSWFKMHLKMNKLEELYAQLLKDQTLNKQFSFIGLEEDMLIPKMQLSSNANILQWILEQKWKLDPSDKDMVVMMHEIEYTLNNELHLIQSSLVLKGRDSKYTAMAATVGLPLAMGVCAYLKGEISLSGVQIPIHPSIYQPILKSLTAEGIAFHEKSYLLGSHS
jgi:saccharopine dehydrogenase-like NADP-dependent oxidoreductase